MSYTINAVVAAGAARTDPTQLSASFQAHGAIGTSALPAAALTRTNGGGNFYFKHLGSGYHSFECADYPAGFRGNVVISYTGTIIGVVNVNPADVELIETAPMPYMVGTVDTSSVAATTSAFVLTGLTGTPLVGQDVGFASGALKGESRKISAYNAGTHLVTVVGAFAAIPANADQAVIFGEAT